MAEITVPTTRGFMGGLTNYGYGAIAGLAYNLIRGITGSGAIGGAIAAAGAGAMIKGPAGDAIPAMLGFQVGLEGLGGLGLGTLFGGGSAAASDESDLI